MNWERIDWKSLERLRAAFLEGTAGARDYWRSESDLASYDQTFGARIAWKWHYVLRELRQRGWSPPSGEVLDWGCGSGVAGRAFLRQFRADAVQGLALHDRSALATRFAARAAESEFPGLPVRVSPEAEPGTLLLSHVLTEMTPAQVDELVALAGKAVAVIWVEPGTYDTSRVLIGVRERLRGAFNVVAPCVHQAACGMTTPENARHWCHHFAPSPPEVFTDSNWARFASLTGIDLHSLPLSFLVLDRRPAPALPPGAVRVIGHPRVYKAHALLLGCDATGVQERQVTKRALPEAFRQLKKGRAPALQVWRTDGSDVTSINSFATD
ncbi:MAG: small ribosomal subunit Rsm22 family protein [Verrucomicrobiota bacterium]